MTKLLDYANEVSESLFAKNWCECNVEERLKVGNIMKNAIENLKKQMEKKE